MLGAFAAPGAQAASGMPLGSFETYKPVPIAGSAPWGIAADPNGAMWFTEFHGEKIGRITMDGSISEYAVPTALAGPYLVAAGPDGAMRFAEQGTSWISKVGNGNGRLVTTSVNGRSTGGRRSARG